jgi:hypothetical protein
MRRLILIGILFTLAAGPWASQALARLLENWPYERLFKEADLVVLARAVAVADSGEKTTDNLWKVEFRGVTTSFEVRHVMKGKLERKKLQVLHFRLADPNALIFDGPLLVRFRLKPFTLDTKTRKAVVGPPEYLLFLRRKGDGRYEPVSGRIDPQLAVREVYSHPPIFPEEDQP